MFDDQSEEIVYGIYENIDGRSHSIEVNNFWLIITKNYINIKYYKTLVYKILHKN